MKEKVQISAIYCIAYFRIFIYAMPNTDRAAQKHKASSMNQKRERAREKKSQK